MSNNKTTYQQTYRQTESGGEKFKTYQKAYRKKRAEQETPIERKERLEKQRLYRIKQKEHFLSLSQEQQDLIKEQRKRYKSNYDLQRKFQSQLIKLETEQEQDEINIDELVKKFVENN